MVLRDAPGAVAKVWLDGVPVAEHPEVRSHAVPTGTLLREIQVRNALLPERWTVTLTEIGPGRAWFGFRVDGSATGFDGEGRSDREFVSTSGRVVTGASSWGSLADGDTGAVIQVGHSLSWDVEDRFRATVNSGLDGTVVTLVSGLRAAEHFVELEPLVTGDLPVLELRWSSAGERPQREIAVPQTYQHGPFAAELTTYSPSWPHNPTTQVLAFQALPAEPGGIISFQGWAEYGQVIWLNPNDSDIFHGIRVPYFSTIERTNGWTLRFYLLNGVGGSPGTLDYQVTGGLHRGFGVMESRLPYEPINMVSEPTASEAEQ